VILRRRFANLMSPLCRELQMIGLLGMSKDDAIEAIVVVKLGKDREVQPCSPGSRGWVAPRDFC
jgi:hypothetical protein